MGRKATQIEEFDPTRVRPLPNQPRQRFRGIKELSASIEEVGQTCPGIVTLVKDDANFDAQLVDGERRLRACRLIGRPFRAEVVSDAAIEDLFARSFAANFGKQHHDAIEIANGLRRLQESGKTIEQLCRIAGKSNAWVSGHLSLLKLHPKVQALMIPPGKGKEQRTGRANAGKLTFALALLLTNSDEARQIKLAKKVIAGGGMSMAAARRLVLKDRAASGEKRVYTNDNGPRRSITTIESIVEDCSNRIGVYLDMPGTEFNSLVDGVDVRTRRLLMEALEETAESLTALRDAIEARLPRLAVPR